MEIDGKSELPHDTDLIKEVASIRKPTDAIRVIAEATIREAAHERYRGEVKEIAAEATESESVKEAIEKVSEFRDAIQEKAIEIVAAATPGGQALTAAMVAKEVASTVGKEIAKTAVKEVASQAVDATESESLQRVKGNIVNGTVSATEKGLGEASSRGGGDAIDRIPTESPYPRILQTRASEPAETKDSVDETEKCDCKNTTDGTVEHVDGETVIDDSSVDVSVVETCEGGVLSEVDSDARIETSKPADETSQNAEIDTDTRIEGNENTENVEDGYKNWDDVPHFTDPETGRERYKLQSGKDAGALNCVPAPLNADIYVSDVDGGNFTKVETDDKGRIVRISRPHIELSDKSQRTNETLNTVDKKDGRRDENGKKLDDGGHLVADEFGGSSEETNLVPMDSKVNQHGEWRKMERDIEKELNKEPPLEINDFEIELEYDDDSFRPSGFNVWYTVDDGTSPREVTKYIVNERTPMEDIRNAA